MRCTNKEYMGFLMDGYIDDAYGRITDDMIQCDRTLGHGGAHHAVHEGTLYEWSSMNGKFFPLDLKSLQQASLAQSGDSS